LRVVDPLFLIIINDGKVIKIKNNLENLPIFIIFAFA